MNTTSSKAIKQEIKHWYLLLMVGLFLMAIGIWVLLTPLRSYITLSSLFSISFLVSGISEIIFSLSNRNILSSWGWKLAFGLLTSIVGFIMFATPLLTIVTLPLYIGFVFLFRSILAISFAFEINNYCKKQCGWLLFLGIIGLIFSIILIYNPLFAGLTLVYWTGLSLITIGIISIYLSIQMEKAANDFLRISEK